MKPRRPERGLARKRKHGRQRARGSLSRARPPTRDLGTARQASQAHRLTSTPRLSPRKHPAASSPPRPRRPSCAAPCRLCCCPSASAASDSTSSPPRSSSVSGHDKAVANPAPPICSIRPACPVASASPSIPAAVCSAQASFPRNRPTHRPDPIGRRPSLLARCRDRRAGRSPQARRSTHDGCVRKHTERRPGAEEAEPGHRSQVGGGLAEATAGMQDPSLGSVQRMPRPSFVCPPR